MPYIALMLKGKFGFPEDLGAIDGCHIPVHPLLADQKPYRNYQKFHSFVIMAIVLYDGTFSTFSVDFLVAPKIVIFFIAVFFIIS